MPGLYAISKALPVMREVSRITLAIQVIPSQKNKLKYCLGIIGIAGFLI